MVESKYYYNGIPLAEYCKQNGINVSTIRSQIFKKRKRKKYANYTDQELVNDVIEAYGTGIKYYYGGMTLSQYCQKNNINFSTISNRITKLKKEQPELTDDELVIKSLVEFENSNYKFFYHGIPLKEYCKSFPDVAYTTIKYNIYKELDKDPNRDINEIIDEYINKAHKGNIKYYYCGIPLKDYCEQNNLNYRNILSYIERHINDNEYIGLIDDEIVDKAMDEYIPFHPKYNYKGVSLYQYCIDNNISYYSAITYIKRKLERDNTLDIDNLIEEAINSINRHGIIYYYKGIPLVEYCKNNNLNADSIRCSIIKRKANSNQPLQEIVDYCVETYQKFEVKYFYKGESLYSFCIKSGISYSTIIQTYLNKSITNPNINIEDIVDNYISNPPIRYFINGESIIKFCDKNSYSYKAIQRRIKQLRNKEEITDIDEIINISIKDYENKLNIRTINEIFKEIKDIHSIERIKEICSFLKVDYDTLVELTNMDFSCDQAINLIWYFSDKEINGNKIITDNKLENIFELVYKLDTIDNKSILDISLYDLIGIYKSGLYDTRNLILLRQKGYIYKTITKLTSNYNIKLTKNNYEDFESEIKMYLIILINRTSLNNEGQIVKYMDTTVKGYFRTYLRKLKQEDNTISLYQPKYKDDKGNNDSKQLIDYIPSEDIVEDSSFSIDMKNILSKLNKDDIRFIMLKYQETYTDEELSKIFNITIEEVKQKELSILDQIRNDDTFKLLKEY